MVSFLSQLRVSSDGRLLDLARNGRFPAEQTTESESLSPEIQAMIVEVRFLLLFKIKEHLNHIFSGYTRASRENTELLEAIKVHGFSAEEGLHSWTVCIWFKRISVY